MRISFESLGIDEWDEDVTDVHFEGSPFTGVAFHESSGGLTERAFADGKPHGRWFSTYADGSLAEESSYEHGKPAGQHREWDKSGQLRREISFGDSFSEKEWDRNGQLTMTFENGIRRRFYPGSSLPYCMVEKNEISFFARSGERAWHVVSQRQSATAPPYAAYDFEERVMKASFSELADFEPTEGGVFLWAQKLLAEQREQGIQVLKSLIQHPNLWVKSTALAIAGSRFVPEVENEIRTCLGDRRTPPSPVGEFGLPGRISTRAIRSCAVAALDKLGLQIDT